MLRITKERICHCNFWNATTTSNFKRERIAMCNFWNTILLVANLVPSWTDSCLTEGEKGSEREKKMTRGKKWF